MNIHLMVPSVTRLGLWTTDPIGLKAQRLVLLHVPKVKMSRSNESRVTSLPQETESLTWFTSSKKELRCDVSAEPLGTRPRGTSGVVGKDSLGNRW